MIRITLAVALTGVCVVACDRSEPPASSAEKSPPVAEEAAPEESAPVSEAKAAAIAAAERAAAGAGARRRAVELELERKKAEIEAEVEARITAQRTAREAEEAATTKKAETKPPPMSRPEPEPVVLAAPPFGYSLVREAPLAQDPRPTLKKVSAKKNGIIDEEAWFITHGLSLPTWELKSLPAHITATYRGGEIYRAIQGADTNIALHSPGRPLRNQIAVVRDALGDTLGAFDFDHHVRGPTDPAGTRLYTEQGLQWAQAHDGVLLACNYHRGYASDSGGLNAFITAIEMSSGDMLWQSAPLVCNSHNFLLRGGWVITGYGFTAEPDFLYVLDARTGETVSKIKVASGPEVILEKAGKLYVRTYNRDYVFALR